MQLDDFQSMKAEYVLCVSNLGGSKEVPAVVNGPISVLNCVCSEVQCSEIAC